MTSTGSSPGTSPVPVTWVLSKMSTTGASSTTGDSSTVSVTTRGGRLALCVLGCACAGGGTSRLRIGGCGNTLYVLSMTGALTILTASGNSCGISINIAIMATLAP